MDRRPFARFLPPKKRKIGMRATAKKRSGKHGRDAEIICVKYEI